LKQYDAIVIGSGCGMNIVEEALAHHLKVALVDRGPLGGTCPNLGCIPSKILIFTADRITEIQESGKLGIDADINHVDFPAIMERMRRNVRANQETMKHNLSHIEGLDAYKTTGHFTEDYTLDAGEQIKAAKIFIATGSRPFIPPLKGLDAIPYLTNESVLQLKEKPESLIIIGGGYIAAEYGHFFAAMGTSVTMLETADSLVLAEEPEISALLKSELSKRMAVHTGVRAEEVKAGGRGITVIAHDVKENQKKEFTAQKILVAVGRVSNADLLKPENTGVALDKRGFIIVDDYLETGKKNIFAAGDVIGRQMFTHVANLASTIAAHNAIHDTRLKMDFSAAPHAVYSHPQIASVGLTEEAARKEHKILVGRANYNEIAQGEAMMQEIGFAKAVVEKKTEKILGFHIIGPYAPVLIQEVINVMAAGGNLSHIEAAMHIHPALPELILRTLANLAED
jgi:mycothione reductase